MCKPSVRIAFCMVLLMSAGFPTPSPGRDVPEMAIPFCRAAPQIDGRLDDPCWKTAATATPFHLLGEPGKTVSGNLARATTDGTWLYVAFAIEHPQPSEIRPKHDRHDAAVHEDDSVEVLLDPGNAGTMYYHFQLNAANVRAEQRVTRAAGSQRTWDIPWRSATCVTDRGWQAELAIPLFLVPSYGNPEQVRLNLCVNKVIPIIDPQGIRVDVKREQSSWAACAKSFHEADAFARVTGLEKLAPAAPFLAMIKAAGVGEYYLDGTAYFYEVTGEVQGFTNRAGKVVLVAADKPVSGGGKERGVEIAVDGLRKVPFRLAVPVDSLVERSALLTMKDAQSGEILETVTLNDLAALNLMTAYVDRSYYTDEKKARLVCRLGMPKQALKACVLTALDRQGKRIGESRDVGAQTGMEIPLQGLAAGRHELRLELRDAKGSLLNSQAIELTCRKPKPGLEWKVDKINRVLLDNGRPFFPFGMIMYGIRAENTEAFREIAQAGFNCVVRWHHYQDPAAAKDYYDATAKHGLRVVELKESFSTEGLTSLKGALVTGQGRYKTFSQKEKSKVFADAYARNVQRMLSGVRNVCDCPNLMAYDTFDEPFGAKYFDQWVQGLDLYQKTNAIDGYHPTYALAGPEEFDFCDIIGGDPYWIPASPALNGSPNYVVQYLWNFKNRAESKRKVLWMVPVAEMWSGMHKRVIHPDEQRCQTYLLLIHGAKGLLYFRYPFSHRTSMEALAKLGGEMRVLGPIAVTPDIPQAVNYQPGILDPPQEKFPDLHVSLRTNPEGGYVLMAANSRYYPVAATYTISGLGRAGSVGRLFSTATSAMRDGSFSDTVEALGTRAYVLKPEGPLPEPVAVTVRVQAHPELRKPEPPAIAREGRSDRKNLVQNPGFEQVTVPGWPDYYWPKGSSYVGGLEDPTRLDAADPFEGKYSLRMDVNERRISFGSAGFSFYLTPQSDRPVQYTFSMYLKGKGRDLKVQLLGFEGDTPWWKQPPIAITSEHWTRYSVSGVIPARLSPYNMFGIVVYGEGTVWADALQVERGEQATPYEP